MRTNILLAIDVPAGAPRQISAEKDLLRELIRDSADHVIVLHVQEFSIPRLAANMLDHGGASGRSAVDKIVAALRAAGIHASGLVREADFGHVGETILTAADEFDARVIVLGSRTRTQFPRGSSGRVASHVMHHSTRPVLIDRSISDNRPPVAASPALV
jgi:nucleotide-binding universal stress UspA family protein